MGNLKKVLFLSGTRADFGKIKSLVRAVEDLDDFESELFVTGMHMLRRYGDTHLEVDKCGFHNVYKFMNQHNDEPMEMVLANTIQGLSRYVHENKPDLMVVHGDRVEALAGAIVGAMNNILVAHIEGGERSGTVDELIRHSVTKLAHIHFVANEEARQRVIQMGEEDNSVFVIGSPDIDVMKSDNLPTLDVVKSYYDIDFDKYHIVMFHPVTTEVDVIHEYANNLVDAIIQSEDNFVIIYPNNDHGSSEIIATYERLTGNSNIKIFPSIRFEYFLTLIEYAQSIIGNSSAGIREAPIYGVPSIDIGTRQSNRYKTESIFCCGYETEDILSCLNKVKSGSKRYSVSEYFGSGNSSECFIDAISNPKLWDILPQKKFNDLF